MTILDRGVPGVLLVEASAETLQEMRERLPDWTMAEETTYPPPGPARERLRGEDPDEPS